MESLISQNSLVLCVVIFLYFLDETFSQLLLNIPIRSLNVSSFINDASDQWFCLFHLGPFCQTVSLLQPLALLGYVLIYRCGVPSVRISPRYMSSAVVTLFSWFARLCPASGVGAGRCWQR